MRAKWTRITPNEYVAIYHGSNLKIICEDASKSPHWEVYANGHLGQERVVGVEKAMRYAEERIDDVLLELDNIEKLPDDYPLPHIENPPEPELKAEDEFGIKAGAVF